MAGQSAGREDVELVGVDRHGTTTTQTETNNEGARNMSENMGKVPPELAGRQCVKAVWVANSRYWCTNDIERKNAHREIMAQAAASARRLASDVASMSPIGETFRDVLARWEASVASEMAATDRAVMA